MRTTKADDVFALPEDGSEAAVVTTNGMVRNNGYAVMGRGVALSAKNNFPGIDRTLGRKLRATGNHAYNLGIYGHGGRQMTVLTMPTKNDWRNPSDLNLIRQSAYELVKLADEHGLTTVYMPRPGCQNGRLSWNMVQAVIQDILDDRFVICLPTTNR